MPLLRHVRSRTVVSAAVTLLAVLMTMTVGAVATSAAPARDFGDAPDSYSTTTAANGASHIVIAGFTLGATVDAEADGQASLDAAGDGADEDGVTAGSLLACTTPNIAVNLTNTASVADPTLDAWIDFNDDGGFGSDEWVASSRALSSGTNVVAVVVPCDAPTGMRFARFRLSDGGASAPDGPGMSGEVEDHLLQIVGVNRGVIAGDDTAAVLHDRELAVGAPGVLANDSDPDGDAVSAVEVLDGTTTGGGTVDLASDGSFTYRPPAGFVGEDSFAYQATDGSLTTNAIVTITVQNSAPEPPSSPLAYETPFETMLVVPAPGLLEGASDPDGDDLHVAPSGSLDTVSGGTATLSDDGSFVYTPPDGFSGEDSFEFTLSDGTQVTQASVTQSVSITVLPREVAPPTTTGWAITTIDPTTPAGPPTTNPAPRPGTSEPTTTSITPVDPVTPSLPTGPAPASDTAPSDTTPGTLPRTGSDIAMVAAAGLGLMLAGAAASRRAGRVRPRSSST